MRYLRCEEVNNILDGSISAGCSRFSVGKLVYAWSFILTKAGEFSWVRFALDTQRSVGCVKNTQFADNVHGELVRVGL